MRERDERRREDLRVPEPVAAVGLAVVAARDDVGELRRDVGDESRGERREEGGEDDLRHDDAEVDGLQAESDQRRTDETAEERVARG
jgi:hypothetical protein